MLQIQVALLLQRKMSDQQQYPGNLYNNLENNFLLLLCLILIIPVICFTAEEIQTSLL